MNDTNNKGDDTNKTNQPTNADESVEVNKSPEAGKDSKDIEVDTTVNGYTVVRTVDASNGVYEIDPAGLGTPLATGYKATQEDTSSGYCYFTYDDTGASLAGRAFTIEGGKLEQCKRGFHYCESPAEVFAYYPPSGTRRYYTAEFYDEVIGKGEFSLDNAVKRVARTVRFIKEYTLPEYLAVVEDDRLKKVGGETPNRKSDGVSRNSYGNSDCQGLSAAVGNLNATGLSCSDGNLNSTGLSGCIANVDVHGACNSMGNNASAGIYRSDYNEACNGLNSSDGNFYSDGLNSSFHNCRCEGLSQSSGNGRTDGAVFAKNNYCCRALYSSFGNLDSEGCSFTHASVRTRSANFCYGCVDVTAARFAIFCCDCKVVRAVEYSLFNRPVSELRAREVFDHITAFKFVPTWSPAHRADREKLPGVHRVWWSVSPTAYDDDQIGNPSHAVDAKEAWAEIPPAMLDYVRSLPEFDAAVFERITGIATTPMSAPKGGDPTHA